MSYEITLCVNHTGVEEDKSVGANQIDTASTGFTTEQEDEFFAFRIVELIHKFLAFRDSHGTIQPEMSISDGDEFWQCKMPIARLLLLSAELFK